MDKYNALISAKILDSYEEMLDKVPQATMFGGKRMRDHVLPSSTEHDYPSSLSVGRMDGKTPATLGGEFWNDFGEGFPTGLQGSGMSGGVVWRDASGQIHSTGNVRNPRKVGGSKALKALKPLAPIAKQLGMTLAKEGIKEGVKSAARSGGSKMTKALKALKPAAPIAKELGMTLAKEGIKEGVKSAARGGRRKSVLKQLSKQLVPYSKKAKPVAKEVAPIAKGVVKDVLVPEGKKALRDYIKESLKSSPNDEYDGTPVVAEPYYGKGRKKMVGTNPNTYTPKHLLKEGGVLIRNRPDEFHSSVYPPSLASYRHSFPEGHSAHGKGRGKVSGGARSARGAIVAEVMKKHGLSLAEASKFVKQNGLY